HGPEPVVSIHPDDARRLGIGHQQFAEVATAQGQIRLRAELTTDVQPGTLFVPLHWSDRFASQARVNTLIPPHVDPVSGQPESKHAAATLTPLPMAWQALLLSRRRLALPAGMIWSVSRAPHGWAYRLAGERLPREWALTARDLLCGPQQAVGWIEYFDSAAARYRAARLIGGKLESVLFVSAQFDPTIQSWLEELFIKERLSDSERNALLSGRPVTTAHATGRIVCACHGVGENELKAAIAAGAASVEALGIRLKAGTNCGSCVPEMRRLLEAEAESVR
ncbi:MAG TPA: molybdopterin dinucleotide binding domain-containing protein, partial [Gammaproteobacteria bacterium]